MKAALIFAFASSAFAQSCPHTLTRTPVGPVLVYQNGNLLKVADYSSITPAGKTMPTIAPLAFADQDAMSVVISRAVPLTFTAAGGTPVTYFSYALWREDWVCSGTLGTTPSPPACIQACMSDGATGQILGGFQSGADAGRSGGIVMRGGVSGGLGIVAASVAGDLIMMIPPVGDGTGKVQQDGGVAQCPPMLPIIESLIPVCHQWVWVTLP